MNKRPRILLWDIETDGLQADRILCIGYKWHREEAVRLMAYDDYDRDPWWSSKPLVEAFADVFNSCDYHATWYGQRFDEPVVQTQLIKYGLPPLAPKTHIDLWRTARYQFKLYSNRLQAWQDHLGLRNDKSPVKASVWIAARHGDKEALEYIYHHCRQDVLVLEGAFNALRPWIKGLPHGNLWSGSPTACRVCDHESMKPMGTYVAGVYEYEKSQCADCGSWSRARRGRRSPSVYAAAR